MEKAQIAVAVAMLAAVVNARAPNYDESKVAPYALEDPLTFADGRKLRDASEWPARRKEILEIFAREMYGEEPPAPKSVVTELREEGSTLAGLAIRRQYRMWFKSDKSGPFLDWLLVLPNRIAGEKPKTVDGRTVCENREKVPVVLMLNYPGNHAVLDDVEVPLPEGGWFRADGDSGDHGPKESNRGALRHSQSRTTVPAEFIVSRGYAFLTACYAQVSPDVEVGRGDPEALAYTHVFELWGAPTTRPRSVRGRGRFRAGSTSRRRFPRSTPRDAWRLALRGWPRRRFSPPRATSASRFAFQTRREAAEFRLRSAISGRTSRRR